jgi:TctA family transporter
MDVVLMMGFGIVGYLFKKLDYPISPLVLAIVIGDKAEEAFRQAMLSSKGSTAIFFATPLCATITGLGLALLTIPLIGALLRRSRGSSAARRAS